MRTLNRAVTVIALLVPLGLVRPAAGMPQDSPESTDMVRVPAGEFWMGRTHTGSVEEVVAEERDRIDDVPARKVYVDAFYLDPYEVTNAEYARFAAATGAATPWYWPGGRVAGGEERLPVHDVNWEQARAYCEWVGKRLPTEAEWEHAARGGLDRKRYPWGDERGDGKARVGASSEGPTAVGSFPPNGYGLHDMAGNVWEWTNDWYERDYYTIGPDRNPTGPGTGRYRVVRGGGWTDGAILNSYRNYAEPDVQSSVIGFRCARSAALGP